MSNSNTDLTFRQLRKTNVNRCKKAFKHRLTEWSLAEWSIIGD